MNLLNIVAILITISALFSYLNYRFIRLPTTIGIMLISLIMSLALIGLGKFGWLAAQDEARELLASVDFNKTLLHGMLSFLLFAGALHVDINDLAKQKWVIGSLATLGVVMSTFIIAVLVWFVFDLVGLRLPFTYCLLFGALISPTDPIAVIGMLKSAGVSRSLKTKIAGESLFNDGVGVVIFIVLLGIVSSGNEIKVGEVAALFAREALGGAVFGLATGLLAYYMLKTVNNYQVEILITLALVMGGYALATAIHVSGPIAIVVAGILIGNHGRMFAMSEQTRIHLDTFWELVDEILNAVLFVLIGLEILVLAFVAEYMVAALVAIPIVLCARFVSVGIPIALLRLKMVFSRHVVKILTWGGLRGGISIALALSLPQGPERDAIVAVTYVVVIFSILVQGLTIGKLLKHS